MRRQFRPTLLPSLATLLLLPVLLGLGFWQLDRAEQKRQMLDELAERRDLPAVTLRSPAEIDAGDRYRPVRLSGELLGERQFLLDNQLWQGRAGYRVLLPLRLEGGVILLDRGWLPAPPRRSELPDLDEPVGSATITGLLDRPPSVGMKMGEAMPPGQDWPRRLAYIDNATLTVALGAAVAPLVLRVPEGHPLAFEPAWTPVSMSPEKHQSYAAQWFSLAFVLVLLYLILNWRKVEA